MVKINTQTRNVTVKKNNSQLTVPNNSINNIYDLSTTKKTIAIDTYRVCVTSPPPPAITDPLNPLLIKLSLAISMLRGQPVYVDDNGKLGLAGSNLHAADGIVTEDGAIDNITPYTSDGHVVRSNWLLVAGTVELQIGKAYYLGNDGMLTTVAPVTGIAQKIGVAASNYMLDVEINQAVKLV